jgi:hypothetical protein
VGSVQGKKARGVCLGCGEMVRWCGVLVVVVQIVRLVDGSVGGRSAESERYWSAKWLGPARRMTLGSSATATDPPTMILLLAASAEFGTLATRWQVSALVRRGRIELTALFHTGLSLAKTTGPDTFCTRDKVAWFNFPRALPKDGRQWQCWPESTQRTRLSAESPNVVSVAAGYGEIHGAPL